MVVSAVTVDDVVEFLGLGDDLTEDDKRSLQNIYMTSARAYIRGFTNLTDDEIDMHEDITNAYLVLINEMYSKRDYSIYNGNNTGVNKCVDNILSMYAKNHIG